MRRFPERHGWLVYLLLFVVYLALTPGGGHWSDMHLFRQWALYIHEHGLDEVYRSGTDYPPLYHYFLWLFTELQGTSLAIENHTSGLKCITLVFDFIGGFLLILMMRETVAQPAVRIALSLLYFLNIAYFYNTVVWGQVDSILACLVIASVFCAYRKWIVPSLLLFVLAISFKVQAIVFLPLAGLVLLPAFVERFSWFRLVMWLGSATALLLLIVLPFWLEGDLDLVLNVVSGSAERYPVISMNAYNLWYWVFQDPINTLDTGMRTVGLAMFFVISGVALFPLAKDVYRKVIQKREVGIAMPKVLLTGALCGLIFFFFNTQMHERYSHPAILMLAGYALLTRRFWGYLLVSIAYFLNMDGVLDHFEAKWLPYDPRIIAGIYLAALVVLLVELYRYGGMVRTDDGSPIHAPPRDYGR